MAVYFIQHTKADSIKFVGHLDLQKALQRNLSRSGLKMAFSKGFNPHMLMSSAQPLSVGMSSDAEYITVELLDAPEAGAVQDALNACAPEGIHYPKVIQVEPWTPAPMALLDAVKTQIRMPSTEAFAERLKQIIEETGPLTVLTRNKKGIEKEKDLRPMILPGAEVTWDQGFTVLTVMTMAGSRNHLNLDHLIQYLRENTEGLSPDRFIHLKRLEMYTNKDGQYLSLGDVR
ncbi:TIGR03936 family radical SAM-associated protein [Clostridiaceae bacterium HFYG-1003]|nr:TIGR03936 family radical SAM-associated protein [Clostridiaceae bacterium HFYG-1003]